MPKVSVVIPSYNHAQFIGQAVESVLNQSESDLELIVVDDGSIDESLEVLSRFEDQRLNIISQANQGAHAAINRGLNLATGKYLAILNSDDTYHPLRLEKNVAILEADPEIGFVGSHIEIINTAGDSLGVKHGYQDCEPWQLNSPERSFRKDTDLRAALLTENFWSTTSNFVFKHEVYQKVGEFRPLRYTHDWDFSLRVANTCRMALLPEPLMSYRVHPSNTIRENQAAMIFEICWILAVHLPEQFGDEQFLSQYTLASRTDQLLNSIFVYGMDRVLNVMLVQVLSQNIEHSVKMLDPDDPTRIVYIRYIIENIELSTIYNPELAVETNQCSSFLKQFFKKPLHGFVQI